jgi:hypothetical protein
VPLKSSQEEDKHLFLGVKVYRLARFFYKVEGLSRYFVRVGGVKEPEQVFIEAHLFQALI